MELWSQIGLGLTLVLTCSCCVSLEKLTILSELQFSHLERKKMKRIPAWTNVLKLLNEACM